MRKNIFIGGRAKVFCHLCGYEWLSASKMTYVTCPNCFRKTMRLRIK